MSSQRLFLLVVLALFYFQNNTATPQSGAPATPKGEPPDLQGTLAGAVKGRPFNPDHVVFSGVSEELAFCQGDDGVLFAELAIAFRFPISREPLEGKRLKLGGENSGLPIRIAVKEGTNVVPQITSVAAKDYAMTLRITKRTPKSLEGTIDLRFIHLANTHLKGTFTAKIPKPTSDPPEADDVPYVWGKIAALEGVGDQPLMAGFLRKGVAGEKLSLTGQVPLPLGNKPGSYLSIKYATGEPRTGIFHHPMNGLGYKITKLPPGEYLIYVRVADRIAAWKHVNVQEGEARTLDLTIDPAEMGRVSATLPDSEANWPDEYPLILIPIEFHRFRPAFVESYKAASEMVKVGAKTVVIDRVPAGKYLARRRVSEAEVEVTAGQEAAVTLVLEPKQN